MIVGGRVDYTATVSGTVLKFVTCEQCQAEYLYRLERTGQFTSRCDEHSLERAKEELNKALEEGIDPVPCPVCGWYQDDMVIEARRLHHAWMRTTGACLLLGPVVGFPILLLINIFAKLSLPEFCGGLAAALLLGSILLFGRMLLALWYYPNSEQVDIRKQKGRGRAMLRVEFEELDETEFESLLERGSILPTKTPSPTPQKT